LGVQSSEEDSVFAIQRGRIIRIMRKTPCIDLGITDSAVAVLEGGEPKIIVNFL
jgi:hypothetical protein